MRTPKKLASLFSRRRINTAAELHSYVVDHPAIAEYQCNELRERSTRWDEALNEVPPVLDRDGVPHPYELGRDLTKDLFFAYNDGSDVPSIRPAADVQPSHEMHRKIMSEFIKSEDFTNTRAYTRGDALGSAMATIAGQNALFTALNTTLADEAERASRMADAEDAMADAESKLTTMREEIKLLRDAGKGGSADAANLEAQIQSVAAGKAKAREQLAEEANAMAVATTDQVKRAVATAAQAAQKSVESLSSLPGCSPYERTNMDPDYAIELAARWASNAFARKVLEQVGRFTRDFRFKHSNRVVGTRGTPIDVELGDDLSAILPSELVKAAVPELRPVFYRDYSQRQLLQFEMEGEAEAGRGPFVIMLDFSDSMKQRDKHIWAKAATLALLSIGVREKRSVGVIGFGTGVVGAWMFVKGEAHLGDAFEFASLVPSGGTTPLAAMNRAESMLAGHEFKRADLVIVTDGEANFNESDLALADRLKYRGVRVHGLSIEGNTTRYLAAVCDTVIPVKDLTGPSEATDHLVQAMT